MKPFWVTTETKFRVAIVLRPRGGVRLEDDLHALRREGVDILISLLTTEEQEELGLSDEAGACARAGIQYFSFAIPDRQVPHSVGELQQVVKGLRQMLRSGKSVGAHCRAGIGRSSLLIAAILCSEGISAEDAFARISEARGLQVPDTLEQMIWMENFASLLAQ